MNTYKNVTLSLPEALLRRFRVYAAARNQQTAKASLTASSATSLTVGEVSVTTSSATAVSILGSGNTGNMTFLSVSANGAPNGIKIQNYSGGFTVTGDGGSSRNGSGGTIQATTGHGIDLANISGTGVSLGYMNITNPGLSGIQAAPVGWTSGHDNTLVGVGVNNFSLNYCTLSDNAGNVSLDDGVTLENASGTVSITNSSISTAPHQGITIDSLSQNMASLTISATSVSGAGADGVLIQMRGTSVITTSTIGGATAALGNTFSNNFSTGLQVAADDTANISSMNVQNNTISGNNAGTDLDLSESGSYNITVQNNTYTNQHTQVINMIQSTSATVGTLTASIKNNTIGTQGTVDSGSQIGSAIRVANGAVSVNVTLDSNVIHEIPNAPAIDVEAQAYTVTGNVKYDRQ